MNKEKRNIEFIEQDIEQEEIRSFSFRNLIDGSFLTSAWLTRQLPFIFFLTMLAVFYIANRYRVERMIRQMSELKEEVKNLRYEQITTSFELMNLGRPSEISKMVEQKELGISFSNEPPKKIVVEKLEEHVD